MRKVLCILLSRVRQLVIRKSATLVIKHSAVLQHNASISTFCHIVITRKLIACACMQCSHCDGRDGTCKQYEVVNAIQTKNYCVFTRLNKRYIIRCYLNELTINTLCFSCDSFIFVFYLRRCFNHLAAKAVSSQYKITRLVR